MDLKTQAGRVYWAYLRQRWRRQPYATMRLAGTEVRFQGLAQRPFDWFGFEMHRGRWERVPLAFFAEAIRPGDTILDLGAFIGAYALLGAKLVGETGRVVAFEPDPVARDHLERNVAVNGLSNVQVIAAAVSDRTGTLTLDASRLGSSQTRIGAAEGAITVPTVALDDFCRDHGIHPSVIKIDVEGAEEMIVGDAAAETFTGARAIVLEVHEGAGANSERICRQFEQWGKRLVQLEERWPGQYNVAFVEH